MKYSVPAGVHSVSAENIEFKADEHGHIDLAGQPRAVVKQLVELAGCRAVKDDHPELPPEPATPAAPEFSVADLANTLSAITEAAASLAKESAELKSTNDEPLRLPAATGKRSITPPRRKPAATAQA